jgi:hypothetical protein
MALKSNDGLTAMPLSGEHASVRFRLRLFLFLDVGMDTTGKRIDRVTRTDEGQWQQ